MRFPAFLLFLGLASCTPLQDSAKRGHDSSGSDAASIKSDGSGLPNIMGGPYDDKSWTKNPKGKQYADMVEMAILDLRWAAMAANSHKLRDFQDTVHRYFPMKPDYTTFLEALFAFWANQNEHYHSGSPLPVPQLDKLRFTLVKPTAKLFSAAYIGLAEDHTSHDPPPKGSSRSKKRPMEDACHLDMHPSLFELQFMHPEVWLRNSLKNAVAHLAIMPAAPDPPEAPAPPGVKQNNKQRRNPGKPPNPAVDDGSGSDSDPRVAAQKASHKQAVQFAEALGSATESEASSENPRAKMKAMPPRRLSVHTDIISIELFTALLQCRMFTDPVFKKNPVSGENVHYDAAKGMKNVKLTFERKKTGEVWKEWMVTPWLAHDLVNVLKAFKPKKNSREDEKLLQKRQDDVFHNPSNYAYVLQEMATMVSHKIQPGYFMDPVADGTEDQYPDTATDYSPDEEEEYSSNGEYSEQESEGSGIAKAAPVPNDKGKGISGRPKGQ